MSTVRLKAKTGRLENRIPELAAKYGHSFTRMAQVSGLNARSLARYEDPCCLPSARVISAICDSYNCRPSDLLVWVSYLLPGESPVFPRPRKASPKVRS